MPVEDSRYQFPVDALVFDFYATNNPHYPICLSNPINYIIATSDDPLQEMSEWLEATPAIVNAFATLLPRTSRKRGHCTNSNQLGRYTD